MNNLARIGLFAVSAVVAAVVFRSCIATTTESPQNPVAAPMVSPKPPSGTAGGEAHEGSVENVPKDDAKLNETYSTQEKVARSEAEWRQKLTDEEYRILRQKGTERAFTGEYWDTKTKGVYCCRACGLALFESDTKFESGCGWPSFFAPLEGARLTETRDTTHGMIRTEITCSRCGGHMGHVFTDGPPPTGLRYCINSASIKLAPIEE